MENATGAGGVWEGLEDLFGISQDTEILEESQGALPVFRWDDEVQPSAPGVKTSKYATEEEFQEALKKALNWNDDDEGKDGTSSDESEEEADYYLLKRFAITPAGYAIDLLTGTQFRFESLAIRYGHLPPVVIGNHKDGSPKHLSAVEHFKRSRFSYRIDHIENSPGNPLLYRDEKLGLVFNTWKPWPYSPTKGNIQPFLDVLNYVAGIEAGRVLQWMALPLQRPGERCNFMLVLVSGAHGVGKDLILGTAVLLHGAGGATVDAKRIKSDFTGYMRGKTLLCLSEAKFERAEANTLKTYVTAELNVINEKNQPAFDEKNRINYCATSNNPDTIPVEKFDRRYWVIRCDRAALPQEIAEKFIAWRESSEGLPALMHYLLHDVDISGFNHKGHAPATEAKEDMRQAAMSDLERFLEEAAESHKVVWSATELLNAFETLHYRSTESAVIKAWGRMGGWAKRRVMMPEGHKPKQVTLYALTDQEKWSETAPADWAKEYLKRPQ